MQVFYTCLLDRDICTFSLKSLTFSCKCSTSLAILTMKLPMWNVKSWFPNFPKIQILSVYISSDPTILICIVERGVCRRLKTSATRIWASHLLLRTSDKDSRNSLQAAFRRLSSCWELKCVSASRSKYETNSFVSALGLRCWDHALQRETPYHKLNASAWHCLVHHIKKAMAFSLLD